MSYNRGCEDLLTSYAAKICFYGEDTTKWLPPRKDTGDWSYGGMRTGNTHMSFFSFYALEIKKKNSNCGIVLWFSVVVFRSEQYASLCLTEGHKPWSFQSDGVVASNIRRTWTAPHFSLISGLSYKNASKLWRTTRIVSPSHKHLRN